MKTISSVILVICAFSWSSQLIAQPWIPQNSGTWQQLHGVSFIDTSLGWAVGNSGMILHTTNGGSTWVTQNSGTPQQLWAVDFVNANNGWAVGSNGVIVHTDNGGDTWITQQSGSGNYLYGVDFIDTNIGWVVGNDPTSPQYFIILNTINGGDTWLDQSPADPYASLDGVTFVNTDTGWAVGRLAQEGAILHTTNGGSTWVPQNSGTANQLYSVSFVDINTGWVVGENGTILHTTNAGSTWVTQNSGFTDYLTGVAFVDANTGWAVGWDGAILHTTNGGSVWDTQNSGTTHELHAVSFVDANHGWATGTSGTILFYDYSLQWMQLVFPNGGDQWHIFQFDTVRWTSRGDEGPLSIELNRNYPSGAWEILTDSTGNDGIELFYITDPLSDHCRVRISTLEDTLSDISDDDFSIVSSQGYLALVTLDQPAIAVGAWDAGFVECNGSATKTFRLKNFGNESIVVFDPEAPVGPYFSSNNSCPSFFALAPGEVSACSLVVTYDPLENGEHYDTLMIMTDAVNSMGGYVRIPLQGRQISTPQTPTVVINIEGDDARLTWEPITESILGCSVDVTGYLIFYSETYEGPYYFLDFTPDTSYVHTWVARFAPSMFYEALAFTGEVDVLVGIEKGTKREEVISELRIIN